VNRLACVLLVVLLTAGCAGNGKKVEPGPVPVPPETTSLLGQALYAPALGDEVREDRESRLNAAREAFEDNPDDVDAVIWLGRRTAYLGHYREAVDIYSDGIEQHPGEARLYRHRGHRHISLRDLDRAIEDLEHAARLVEGVPDEIEPDGLPNARNTPTSTLQSNVWYHLGLAYYLEGEFEQAARCYRECEKFSNNPDMLSATSHWLYMTLRRLDRQAEAEAVLESIHADMDIIENRSYHELLMLYKGERDTEQLMASARSGEDGIGLATVAYGVTWYAVGGRPERAETLLLEIVDGGQWAAFGHIAAEADLARTAVLR